MSRSLLTPGQARAAQAPGSVAVTAGAGTGKTHMLTERYVHHVRVDGFGPLEIVAATFTDRAAAELRSRIRARLRTFAGAAEQTAELEAAQIGTLHSLAGRICREHPEAAGVPFDFVLQDALEQRLWRERHFTEAIALLPENIERAVPFRTLAATLRVLLDDPYTAEQALEVAADTWPALIEEERKRLYCGISQRESWRAAVATLRDHQGPSDDKMEMQRAAAVAALDAFAAHQFTAEACTALDTLHAGRGSKKVWSEPTLDALKDACRVVRDAFREGKYAFLLQLTEADEVLVRAQADVRRAFEIVQGHFDDAKRRQRVLDFNDLEICALRALRDPEVRAFYAARWKAFLVDEFQDTNPVQAELLARLTENAKITVVGDEKQSIYSFRRADVRVFQEVCHEIRERGGEVLELARSFRTHACLMQSMNDVVRPALASLHQPLEAERADAPGEGPYLSVRLIDADRGVRKPFRRRAEAYLVGEIVEKQLLGAGVEVYDKASHALRRARPGDVAILARTWNELEPFGVELAARGIPTIHAGGGDLFGQREAKDAIALLRFLADPTDDLALVAALRSPFFAVADSDLTHFAMRVQQARWGRGEDRSGAERVSWWDLLSREPASAEPGSLAFAAGVLAALREHAQRSFPSALLGEADEATGFTATIANLPGGPRRLADWRGFVELVQTLERGHGSVFSVVRQLSELIELEGASVPRPAMEAGDAVSLTTVHNAKGLEWPVVIVPDMTAANRGRAADAHFDPEAGVAFKVRDDSGEEVEPALFTILRERAKAREAEEEMRVLYVALTRARDRLFLTANKHQGGKLDQIGAGLEQAGIEAQVVAFRSEDAVPRTPRPGSWEHADERLLAAAGPGLAHLPATSITAYAVCPKYFEYEFLHGHPGAPARQEVAGSADGPPSRRGAAEATADDGAHRIRAQAGERVNQRIGTLAHTALERHVETEQELQPYDPALEAVYVTRALELASVFRTSPVFANVRGERIRERERYCWIEIGGTRVHGIADAVGESFVLDYKTGDPAEDGGHDLQVAIYSEALRVEHGYIAYLRAEHDARPAELIELNRDDLAAGRQRVRDAIERIRRGDFAATPGERKCRKCAYEAICTASALKR